ncbi:cuticle protein AMP1B-like [Penaeus japonicus]|uniref:cuticle protein AMP1B-like n=1 Tax=Penaeus japonicus TaxID=27405 RepID=UPI001C715D29|nr:cuticle protein AMP1B-like [Penaeus japonicus]
MKLVLFACLAAAAVAFPQNPEGDAEVVYDERTDQGDGNFRYAFETTNGIRAEKTGVPGAAGQSNMQGSFTFPLPEGGVVEVTYVADEDGYRPESDAIPTPGPVPEFVKELLAIAAEQRAAGIRFDEQGFQI